jgi:hypothetical protein
MSHQCIEYEQQLDRLRAKYVLEANACLAKRIEEMERERDNAWDRYAEVVTENRLLREAISWWVDDCPQRCDSGYDTCEDNCSVDYRYQERCLLYLSTVQAPLTAAEAERECAEADARIRNLESAAAEAAEWLESRPDYTEGDAATSSRLRAALGVGHADQG